MKIVKAFSLLTLTGLLLFVLCASCSDDDKVRNLEISVPDELTLTDDTDRLIPIYSGSGSYSFHSDNESIVSISEYRPGEILRLSPQYTGETIITVKDNRTKQQKKIRVSVVPAQLILAWRYHEAPQYSSRVEVSHPDAETVIQIRNDVRESGLSLSEDLGYLLLKKSGRKLYSFDIGLFKVENGEMSLFNAGLAEKIQPEGAYRLFEKGDEPYIHRVKEMGGDHQYRVIDYINFWNNIFDLNTDDSRDFYSLAVGNYWWANGDVTLVEDRTEEFKTKYPEVEKVEVHYHFIGYTISDSLLPASFFE